MAETTKSKASLKPDSQLQPLDVLAGTWEVEVNNPNLPGKIQSIATFEWFQGGKFLIQRTTSDHPDFPAGIMLIGYNEETGNYTQHYFDSRGMIRNYDLSLKDKTLKIWRDDEDFAQRFTGNISEDGDTINAAWEMAKDHVNFKHDFDMTYRRVK